MQQKKVLIVGGGLAGLTAAIHLSKIGIQVTVVEKNSFPQHKVCGEYISNEVLPYFDWLKLNLSPLHPSRITRLEFSTAGGKTIKSTLPLGGFGISRYVLDAYLYQQALKNGCEILQDTVVDVAFDGDQFTITTAQNGGLTSEIVLGAFGKRSNLDQKMRREFFNKKSHWLAVKGHYKGDFPSEVVGLHNFNGGYCGVSKVENEVLNICYLADYKTFKQFKNIEDYQNRILAQNPHLQKLFEECSLLFEKPLTISQVSFDKKRAVENHVLMMGDTAGLIHPLCGNGMAMAIHSAKIASELVSKYFLNEIKSRKELEDKYIQQWNSNFKNRLRTGRFLNYLFQKPALSALVIYLLTIFPFLLAVIIKKTHGKSILSAS